MSTHPKLIVKYGLACRIDSSVLNYTSAYGFSSSMVKSSDGVADANLAAADSFPNFPTTSVQLLEH